MKDLALIADLPWVEQPAAVFGNSLTSILATSVVSRYDGRMQSKSKVRAPSEQAIRSLLDRYACPVRYHEVRTRSLGNIATPLLGISPMEVVKGTTLDTTFQHVRELTRIMETEIHEAVLSCTRARRRMLEGVSTEKPTLH